MNQKGSTLILIVLGILVGAILLLGSYLILKPKNTNISKTNNTLRTLTQNPQITTPPVGKQKPSVSPIIDGYKKKQFTANDKFADQEAYPAELINFNESDLVGMKCTPKYSDNVNGPGDPEFYFDGKYGIEPQDVITDQQKKELISEVDTSNTHLSDAQFCRTEDNKLIWSYGTDYFSPKQITYFELATLNNENANIVKIVGNKYAWFSCGKPLMLTNSGILYYQCQGGGANIQNPMVEQIIYSIDLNSKSYKQYSLKRGSSI